LFGPVVELLTAPRPTYWGPWATVAFYVLFVVVYFAVGMGALIGFGLTAMSLTPDAVPITAATRANLLLGALWVIAPCEIAGASLLAWLRRGESVQGYLGLKHVPFSAVTRWLGAMVVLVVLTDLIQLALHRPIVPAVMVEQYRNANPPLLWSAAILAAPLWEEIVFRGFLLTGFINSRLGNLGGVLLTTALFAVLHTQYDAFGIASVASTGILLGYARITTGSTVTPLVMHIFGNVIAAVETAFVAAA
jgi:membrane protease YdiL (CAAX protease family)